MRFGNEMMKIVVLPGDDIGPEIASATMAVVEAANNVLSLDLTFERLEVGMSSLRTHGTTVPEHVLKAAEEADGIILGPAGITNYPPVEEGGINVPGTIRKRLDLFANIRPARSRSHLPDARPGLDCVIVRENTEGFYSDRNMFRGIAEFMPTEDCALSIRKITASASRRIAEVAFEIAANRRKSVTVVGKRHVLELTDGLFVREAEAVAERYSDIALREVDIDTMAASLYTRPESFDVILTSNMFGDILSNQAIAMAGGLGLAAALNAGDKRAAANAGHGSAPDIAGRNIANPTSLILSSAMLLEWLGRRNSRPALLDAATAIKNAVEDVLAIPEMRTTDLGGQATTSSFGIAVRDKVLEIG
jgi:3-isopropylmalate dehydrogenase